MESNFDDICAHCARFFPIRKEAASDRTIQHHQNVQAFLEKVDSCVLCMKIRDEWSLQYLHNHFLDLKESAYGSIGLSFMLRDTNLQINQPAVSSAILDITLSIPHHAYTGVTKLSITTCNVNSPDSVKEIWMKSCSSKSERIKTLSNWFEECMANHDECSGGGRELPKRLIKTCLSEGEEPRLILTENLNREGVFYAALSHCWGDFLPLRTTQENEQQLMARIPSELIPRTFQDALDICKALNIPYLWIDALCISQNDGLEWQSEAAKMNQIYAGSHLTIAAEDAENGLQGCFGEIDTKPLETNLERRSSPSCFAIREENSKILVRVQRGNLRELTEQTILSSRGWTLQEQVLSSRIAYCMQGEIHWQCYCRYQTETGLVFSWPTGVSHSSMTNEEHYAANIWHEWMENYSGRKFTIPSDRLAALAGLVQQFQSSIRDEPFLEAWGRSIIKDLIWLRKGDVTKSDPLLNIPSWSWLSRCEHVSYRHWESYEEATAIEMFDRATVKAWDIKWTGLPYTSEVKSTRLVLEGPTKEIKLSIPPETTNYNPLYLNVEDESPNFEGNPTPWRCTGQFDFEDFRPPTRYTCLLMHSRTSVKNQDELWFQDIFLILEPALEATSPSVYRRVGIGAFFDKNTRFDLDNRTEIQLV